MAKLPISDRKYHVRITHFRREPQEAAKKRTAWWTNGISPAVIFLTAVIPYSSLHLLFHLPSLRCRYKVALQMESPSVELEFEAINPAHVINQYNLPISESRTESLWQMMVQWGLYFGYAWFIIWLSQFSGCI